MTPLDLHIPFVFNIADHHLSLDSAACQLCHLLLEFCFYWLYFCHLLLASRLIWMGVSAAIDLRVHSSDGVKREGWAAWCAGPAPLSYSIPFFFCHLLL
jgi:hypothetical protein